MPTAAEPEAAGHERCPGIVPKIMLLESRLACASSAALAGGITDLEFCWRGHRVHKAMCC
jgi:hypothetical protein